MTNNSWARVTPPSLPEADKRVEFAFRLTQVLVSSGCSAKEIVQVLAELLYDYARKLK